MRRRPPRSPLFPYTTLFRSARGVAERVHHQTAPDGAGAVEGPDGAGDRKSTRLNSSHSQISDTPFFFFNETATPEISPLSLHDALPICPWRRGTGASPDSPRWRRSGRGPGWRGRSEEHTSELQSQSNLGYPLFFF